MDKNQRRRVTDRILVLTLFVQVLILVNQVLCVYTVAAQSMQASMAEPTGENLEIDIKTDTGRPGPLDKVVRILRNRDGYLGSWLASWVVDGEEATDAVIELSISVTGSNVITTSTVDYYVEAVPQSGGSSYRFLEGNDTSVTVDGSPFEDTDDRGINSHLEAMNLATDQTHTIDYYIYVKADTTGAISGDTLTSEITRQKFDTKEYTYFSPSVSAIYAQTSTGYQGYVRHSPNTGVWHDDNIYYGSKPSYSYSAFSDFRTDDTLSGYPDIPSVDPGTLTIHDAWMEVSASYDCPSQTVTTHIYDSTSWSSSYIDEYSDWDTRFSDRLPVNVSVSLPTVDENERFNITGLAPVVQEYFDNHKAGSFRHMTCFFHDAGDTQSDIRRHESMKFLYLTYSEYEASWYPLPPLSLASLPVTLDVVALSFLVAATGLALRENRRKKY